MKPPPRGTLSTGQRARQVLGERLIWLAFTPGDRAQLEARDHRPGCTATTPHRW